MALFKKNYYSVASKAKRAAYSAGAAGAYRTKVVGQNRGYLRTGGFYGRFRGRRTSSFNNELKFLDTTLSVAPMAAAGAVSVNLNVVPQGDTESMRNGRKIVIKSIWLRGALELTPGAAAVGASADFYRLILVQDKQANGQTFAVTDYLATAGVLSHRNLANTNRFVNLWEMYGPLTSQSGVTGASGNAGKSINKYHKCNIPIEFDATAITGVIGTQRSNSIALITMCADAVTVFNGTFRIRYSDNS